MTASGADKGICVEVIAGDAVAPTWVRELLEVFRPGVDAEFGAQAASAIKSTTRALVRMRN
jgi:hypothetical protein